MKKLVHLRSLLKGGLILAIFTGCITVSLFSQQGGWPPVWNDFTTGTHGEYIVPQGTGNTYDVGPGETYTSIGDVPWESVSAGDTVRIHYRATPYAEKIVITGSGTESEPIAVIGIPGPNGELPVIEGANAITRLGVGQTSSQSRGAIVVEGDSKPEWIYIANLEVRNVIPSNTYTNSLGSVVNYAGSAAGIYIVRGEFIHILNCTVTLNSNGIFVASYECQGESWCNGETDAYISKDILIEGNRVYNNAVESPGNQTHNNYTEALRITYQYNYMGDTFNGVAANSIKDRSAGTVIRYNWIEGVRPIDVVEAEGGGATLWDAPEYDLTAIYGNVIVKTSGASNDRIVHYGGDNAGVENTYRTGTLYFYNNTVISKRQGTALFGAASNDQLIDARNNIIWADPAQYSQFWLVDDDGDLEFHNNWVVNTHGNFQGSGGIINDSNTTVGTNPGFLSATSDDYRITDTSPAAGLSGSIPSAVATGFPVNKEYVIDAGYQARANADDLGAFAAEAAEPPELTSVSIQPSAVTVNTETTYQFSASALDQYGNPFSATILWSLTGDGSVDTNGLYTAPTSPGSAVVTATSGSFSDSANVTVQDPPPPTGNWKDNIPSARPRIFYDSSRWADAVAWHTANPFEPSSATNPVFSSWDPVGNAIKYRITGNSAYADIAIQGIKNATDEIYSQIGGHCDQCRWYGESVIVTYDFLYDYMSQSDRDYIYTRLDQAFDYFLDFYWGAAEKKFVENNYFWGYMRNAVLWGIAIYHENPTRANYFIDRAINERWEAIAKPYYLTEAPGGLPSEGNNYGPAMLYYNPVMWETMKMYGRDIHEEVDYYRNAVWTLIYQTLPGQGYDNPNSSNQGWAWYPYGDNAGFHSTPNSVVTGSIGQFMVNSLTTWDGTPLEQYLRRWLTTTGNINTGKHLYYSVDNGGSELPLSDLPEDYFTPGVVAYAYTKSSWDPDATAVNLQLATPPSVGHEHYDSATWQMWRDGVWLSRETPGRGFGSGWQVTGYGGSGAVDVQSPLAHNSLLYNGAGVFGNDETTDPEPYPQVIRLESEDDYFYSVVDVSDMFRMPAEVHTEREFIFVKPLEALIIFDRMLSASAGDTKTFISHFQGSPSLNGNTYTHTNRDQTINLTTLVPASPSSRLIVDEGRQAEDNAHRVEIETTGSTLSYFLNVVQARAASGDSDLTISLDESSTQYEITLEHPTKGNAVVIIEKGANNSGGSFAYNESSVPSGTTPFSPGVEKIITSNNGVVWSDTIYGPGEQPGFDPNPDAVITTVSVSPASATVSFNGTQQFTATAYDQFGNPMATSFTWSSSGSGSINSSGLYTAGSSAGSATVTATTGSVSGNASVTVSDPSTPVLTTINVSPATASVGTGQTQQFTAETLDQFGNPLSASVSWSNTGSGSINTSGLYTAPVTTGSDTVTATSGGISGSATVDIYGAPILPVRIDSLTPAQYATDVSVDTDLIIDLEGLVTSAADQAYANPAGIRLYQTSDLNTPVFSYDFTTQGPGAWQGTDVITFDIPTLEENTEYVILAPYAWVRSSVGSVGGFSDPADSNTEVWKFTTGSDGGGSTPVLTTIVVSPNPVTLNSGANQQFSAQALDQDDNPMSATFTWSSTGSGSIDSNGLYTAGSGSGSATVTASADSVNGTASVTVTEPPAVASISVTPETVTIDTGSTVAFSATVLDQFGNPVEEPVIWGVEGDGSIDANGLYQAANDAGTDTVTAISNGLSASATVTVEFVPVVSSIIVTPAAASIAVGNSQQYTATVLDQNDNPMSATVTWGVSGVGSISSVGLYNAGSVTGNAVISAIVDGVSGSTTVQVTPPPGVVTTITLDPASVTLNINDTQQFTATVLDQYGNPISATLTWSASGSGSVDANGNYTAPSSTGSDTVTASANGVSGQATITIEDQGSSEIEIFRETQGFVFYGGQGTAGTSGIASGEGVSGSSAIKYQGITPNNWNRVNALDFSASPLAADDLEPDDFITISIDLGNIAAPVNNIVLHINGLNYEGAPSIALPEVDNVAGYQTFFLDLGQAVVDQINLDGGLLMVHPSHPSWPVTTIWIDDIVINGLP